MLALGPLVALFLVTTATLGAVVVKEALDRATAPKGAKVRPKEGEIVSGQFVGGSEWVVKVYYSKNGYEVQVLYAGEFQVRKTGFGSQKEAETWGINYAKQRGA